MLKRPPSSHSCKMARHHSLACSSVNTFSPGLDPLGISDLHIIKTLVSIRNFNTATNENNVLVAVHIYWLVLKVIIVMLF